jgi:putative DNA primase/helicase
VEAGELDSSFRKDVARLKGFLTRDYDKIRPPYAREAVDYPRRTVFLATVNDTNFLVDTTGNSRWWTIPVEALDFDHDIDMQQLFAQLAVEFQDGEQWWLTADEEKALEEQNRKHLSVSAIRERIMDQYEKAEQGDREGFYVTPMELLERLGYRSASNTQCKEAAAVLRELACRSSRVQGRDRWRVKPSGTANFVSVPGTPRSGPSEYDADEMF